MFKILIVEDDPTVSRHIAQAVTDAGWQPIMVTDFTDVLGVFVAHQPDLVLMDINLPGGHDGFHWNTQIRADSQVPVIFISSRNSNMDMISAMNSGADDYVEKPFSASVLLAKINALLRRTYHYSNQSSKILEYGGVTLNLEDSSVQVSGKNVDLTKNEYKLLQYLIRRHGTLVSRPSLLRALWEDEHFVDDNTLTVNINRLRKKLADAGLATLIQTKVGKGYVIP
ncbi:response regulator transcription factor [Schleiferilactobacillus shenzhenensis]|uniref:BceR n=1 Tax=Schleiferilactobacillus shenzhenensis LY-73 TaxID=1231336 RepID=U4TXT1_9LACO|nr:response regulator transcription factor [Schleiferilactobacillus shenzhenensis]ERL66152.1 BceR [Schleiferilactobacillus shenzhenensis LY-73]